MAQPDTAILVNETEMAANHDCNELNFDPREKQQEFDGNRIKVLCCGEKLFARLYDTCKRGDDKGTMQSKLRMNWQM